MKFNLLKAGLSLIPLLSEAFAQDVATAPVDTVPIYFYNANKNKCLRTTGLPDSDLSYGDCDTSDNIVWIIPTTHYGNYRSKVNPDYCLSLSDGKVSLKECSEETMLYRDGNFIKSQLSEKYCIGSSGKKNDPNGVSLKECDINDPDQIFYFNIWDFEVNEEDPVITQPEGVTIYFYNALKNVCLNSNGTTVNAGDCSIFEVGNDESLWIIPDNHYGYYRPKTNPEKCLSIVDGVVSLDKCSEETILYRDGNFIRSKSSDDHCVAISMFDNSLEFAENCEVTNSDHMWYFNIWTVPEVEEPVANPEPSVYEIPAPTTTVNVEPTVIDEVKPTEGF